MSARRELIKDPLGMPALAAILQTHAKTTARRRHPTEEWSWGDFGPSHRAAVNGLA